MPSKPSRLPTAPHLLNGLAEKELGEENELHDLSCNGKSIARSRGFSVRHCASSTTVAARWIGG